MTPLLVLLACWLIFGLVGRLGVSGLDSGEKAGRAALAVMFVFTGATHFSTMKHEYLAMIPAPLPRTPHLIHLTGALEIAGGLGLLPAASRRFAAWGLVLLLLAMFPANVNAALNGIPFRGESPTSLWIRTPIQLVFLVSVWWSALRTGTAMVPRKDEP